MACELKSVIVRLTRLEGSPLDPTGPIRCKDVANPAERVKLVLRFLGCPNCLDATRSSVARMALSRPRRIRNTPEVYTLNFSNSYLT